MASFQAPTVDALPTELLSHVFSFFDGPAPSDARLKDQPGSDMLRNADCPLKNVSLVSKRWRAIALPMLFHNVLWTLERCDQLVAKPAHDSSPDSDPFRQIPILAFLQANNLARHVRSLTIMICHKAVSAQRGHAGPADPLLEAHAQHSSMARSAAVYHEDNNWLWAMLFRLMDPLRLTIIASPQTLARLLSCMVFVGDVDFFSSGERLHILSLSRNSRSAPPQPSASSQTSQPPAKCCFSQRRHPRTILFTIRPWTHLLLNENSSIRAYRSYHYFDRRPPSVLTSLLGQEESPNNVMLIPPTVTSLSYIAIFPLSAHFNTLMRHLPPVEHFYVQLVPRNDILLDKDEMNHVQPSDLWLECHTCYELFTRRVLAPREGGVGDENGAGGPGPSPAGSAAGWQFLRWFEMSDGELREDSSLVELLGDVGWEHEGEGVFVRGPVDADSSSSHIGNVTA